MSCSVLAAIKHHISPVCTWKTSDVDQVGLEGRKLAEYIARERPNRGPRPELCKLVEDLTIFGRKWKVVTGNIVFGTFGFEQEEELYETLNKYLLRHGMCIFSLHGATCLIIQHGDYFAVVDCGSRNSQGLPSESGTSVVVFNTCLNDLMIHLINLRESLNAVEYGISAISVQEMYGNVETRAAVTADKRATDACHSASSHVASLSGSFHQGDAQFKYAGVQCAAISAVALTKHTLDSVFLWNADTLDDVVVLGNELYTFLRDNNLISGGSQLLSVPDLPKKMQVHGQSFDYAYGDYVTGAIDVLQKELIDAGVLSSLWDGLSKMCAKYETSFITISGNTCALISSNGRYAIVDSHARDSHGMIQSNGKSVVLYFNTLDEVFVYIKRFSSQLNVSPKLFEISGVHIVQMDSSKIASEHAAVVPGTSGVFDQSHSVDMQDDSCGEHSSQLDMSDMDDVQDDVVVTGFQSNVLYFNPVSEEITQSLCGKLNVDHQRANSVSCVVGELGVPCMTDEIVGDGNCFFRALSQAISGTQKNHRKIRLAVVNQLQRNSHMYDSILRSEYSSLSQYIAVSRMQYVGSWATEVEIQAAADYFGVNIFTFCNDKWLEYSSLSSLSNYGLYLRNINGNHYETVTCVKQPQSQTCYGYCMNVSGEYKTRNAYKKNLLYKEQKKLWIRNKYRDDETYQESFGNHFTKYHENESHRNKLKQISFSKYHNNESHREKRKQISIAKYRDDKSHRDKVKDLSRKKYLNPQHKSHIISNVELKRREIKIKSKEFDFVVAQFLDKVKEGPNFVCCVCFRLLFKHQVLNCRKDSYRKTKEMSLIADKCISDDYVHICNDACITPCNLKTCRNKLYICYCCHHKISKGQMPPESSCNNLTVDDIPPQLACLNTLEQHLIALHIPFMKMLALPKGGQNGVHGPVTCVPANVVETCSLLPRSNMEGSLLPVKLKRKLTYKGHYDYQYVDSMHVQEALWYLKHCNFHYKDVEFNESWINEFVQEDNNSVLNNDSVNEENEDIIDENDDDLLHDRQQHCMFQDTCLMPVDIGQEALDLYVDNVLNVAPSENNNPIKLLSDCTNEAKCFPVLFPSGFNTYHEKRQYRLTLSRYFNNRLLHADGRFARNVEYIFFAQYMSELEQVVSKVSIALRKGTSCTPQNMSEVLKDEQSINKLLEFDDGYRFLKPIRGTPAFWQTAQRDLLACVRMLGKPTWFASFSSADMRWTNLLYSILKQEGRTQTLEQLQWAEKCELLRRNPVTAARMFDFRWHVFVREVLMSPANPIGKIEDYYYRVEFQQRGSPHCHCLFWICDAPILDKNTDEEVIAFIDKYVTCEIPSEEDSLSEVVTSVQQHSKRHSKTCKKKRTVCRFNFPRPASCRTFICRGEKYQDPVTTCKCNLDKTDGNAECECIDKNKTRPYQMERDVASDILTRIKNAISGDNCPYNTVEEMFESLCMNQDLFETAYKRFSRNTHVVLKRQINEIWINQYSRPLLKAWNANIDIQYCVDAYACCVYIVSYMSKSEREIGLLLGNAQREAAKEGNVSAKEALKRLGSVYLHNRDVCAQEAVYRLTNMHLKECSRKVVFIPTGDNIVKMSLPISVLKQKATLQDLAPEDMWMTGIVDRYKNRPNDDVFSDMCLAKFASEYRVLSKNEKCKNSVKLNKDFGIVVKRTRTKPAVVRYARFSETKEPEKFYQSIMQLFMPYRFDNELKPAHCESFGDFYRTGVISFVNGTTHSVKSVVDLNRSEFEVESDHFEAVDNVTGDVMLEDAWAELCPEVELERLECVELQKERPIENSDQEQIPDLSFQSKDISVFEKRKITRTEGLALIRSLNEKQFSVFYQIRQWCLAKVNGKNPEPLHIFITGGAGTGKSHLIKAIEYESKRLLSTVCQSPDNTCVLLTAPTGIAAYNLEATTIHTTFSIGKDVRLPYTPLSEDKLNSLRVKYCDLQLLIIDEISMVDHNLLSYVHGRLRQIKQSVKSYGNISVIVVGDMYQLPPVKGKPLYSDGVATNIWSDLFKIVELTEIVRQKDAVFSQLLNRMRTRSKGTPILADDLQILKRCETGEVSSALHIFATNKQVNEHNIHRLYETCPEFLTIGAQDYVNDKKTGKLRLLEGHHAKASNTCLSEVLLLGNGARVMLCKNVDVSDGLVNGVCGTVTEILIPEKDKFPKVVYVKFDDERVGMQKRKSCHYPSSDLAGSTPIGPEEERATVKGGMRRQFPLRLAWACTVHKVQGLTVDEAVVSFSKIFAPGQAYVAISRVRNLLGLTIENFDEKRIYCKDDILVALQNMTPVLSGSIELDRFNTSIFTVFLMNVQSLNRHVKDLACYIEHWKPKCIAVTETWVSSTHTDTVKIDGYSFTNRPRCLSYNTRHPELIALQDQQHGGVGIYCADDVEFQVLPQPELNLECLVHRFCSCNMVLGVIYRPPLYPLSLFKNNLGKLLDWLEKQSDTIALIGDFNDDIFKSSTIKKFVCDKGYIQIVKEATTEKDTLIDHVYVKSKTYKVEAVVVPTYFSDHEGVMCGVAGPLLWSAEYLNLTISTFCVAIGFHSAT
ncbi:uncharacterized protein LOC122820538 [Gambusia affinis]|uniref:uncharacterized protein LOC122820538 n=1 Tax=Gambusia affinis TaxID=33528 RepID=UPI001CDC1BD7|nr:uncharacterized protein LOC122820538 [Gambusia affinis]